MRETNFEFLDALFEVVLASKQLIQRPLHARRSRRHAACVKSTGVRHCDVTRGDSDDSSAVARARAHCTSAQVQFASSQHPQLLGQSARAVDMFRIVTMRDEVMLPAKQLHRDVKEQARFRLSKKLIDRVRR